MTLVFAPAVAHRSASYVVHEQYADQSALHAHEASAHGAEFFPKIRALCQSLSVEYFDGVVE